jgi:ubiquinone/menaquinone biosynthesis C-methylase UbiE
MSFDTEIIAAESARIEREYRRREAEIDSDLYAPWQPAENFILSERKAEAAYLLKTTGSFPKRGDKCLEIGYGKLGWLADLISWELIETDLSGIELDAKRAALAQTALPNADLRVGDATKLPWEDAAFNFVIVSTVFSSIINKDVRRLIAREIERVLVPKGVLIWYDLAVDNPKNKSVKSIGAKELKTLFTGFEFELKRVTLAPPVARFVAPKSFALAALLRAFPFLRTHLLGIIKKKS